MKLNYKSFGKYISDYRKQTYKSLGDVADKCRFMHSFLRALERGSCKPSIANMRAIADALADEENHWQDIWDGMEAALKEATVEEVKEKPIATIVCRRGSIWK